MIHRFSDERGYTNYIDSDSNKSIREHQLVALVENDAQDVFPNIRKYTTMFPPQTNLELN